MALRRTIIDLGRLRFLNEPDQIGSVGQIAVMQEKLSVLGMWVFIEVIDARRIEDDERRLTPWTT